ncbi:MAG: hypothetical protein B7Y90_05715 [Alphaproteobacteria bacterium 32-64-14]|nr:MAG: hypothetical protein B7Y90_05715 [Alphaproteobacteria bacterium 32-64-14]
MTETHILHEFSFPLDVSDVQYIKLGKNNCWADNAISEGKLVFGDPHVSHDLALKHDWNGVAEMYRTPGKTKGAVTRATRELKDFYTKDERCLWVTFVGDRLYWAFAESSVHFDAGQDPPRYRKTIGGWRDYDAKGNILVKYATSTAITMTAATHNTICAPDGADHLLRRINAQPNADSLEAERLENELAVVVARLVASLSDDEFEILAARVAEAAGWRIESAIGGRQADIDFTARIPALNLMGYFQVKTKADNAQVAAFVAKFAKSDPLPRLIFITHSRDRLQLPAIPNFEFWAGKALARRAIGAGLLPWIKSRAT